MAGVLAIQQGQIFNFKILEKMISVSEKKNKVKVKLVVNGREKEWESETISFKQAVILAFGAISDNPNICYTVTYTRGPRQNREGSMVKGDEVYVRNKMIFNVTSTDKS